MLYQLPTHEYFGRELPADAPENQAALYANTPERQSLGYTLQTVEVPDMSELSPDFALTNEALNELDDLLVQHPEWEAPEHSEDGTELILDPRNIASNVLYAGASNAVTHQWRRDLVPSALALETLALKSDYLPMTDTLISDNARDIFVNGMDAISIRTRGTLMSELVADHAAGKNADDQKWLSLACGAARPVLEAASRVKGEQGAKIDVTLVDYDPKVLEYSSDLADDMDAVTGHTQMESDLRRTMIARDTLVDTLGEESMNVVDVLGFLEYCPDKAAVNMLRNSYRLTAPGGVLVTSNMRDDRPQKEFHLRGIGWPGVQMRSADEIVGLAIRAGIDPSHIEAYQPADGVYNVFKITKPARV